MRVAIIGGGAAGMMCAATLQEANPEAEIFLIERNDGLGKKVIISGGGRCNVTTGINDVKTVLSKYPRGGKFLSSAMYGFPPDVLYDWFEARGVPLKTQEDQRVFPVSDNGKDIVGVFEKLFADSQVNVMLKMSVVGVKKEEGQFEIQFKTSPIPLKVDVLVLTTGGQAYRQTGSTGDGYAFASTLGHTITPLAPSLNAFFTQEAWPATISGLSFEKAKITAKRGKRISFTGPFLFTHRGVSGPAVFALSSLVAFEKYDKEQPLEIEIDLSPDDTHEAVRERLYELVAEHGAKQFVNVLGFLIPKSLAEIVVSELQLPDKRANEVSKAEMHAIITWLKAVPLHVIQRGAGDEFVTAGGVVLSEVDPSTMQSKICPNLYFAGEILDVDGYTGGFNLQASWAAGRLAGLSIASSIPS